MNAKLNKPKARGDVAQQRGRVLGGVAACVAQRGYAATTIADIVSAAGISRATFYDHFPDKHSAFLALYSDSTDRLLEISRGPLTEPEFAELVWTEQIRRFADAYLEAMALGGDLTRAMLVEAPAVSAQSLQMRRQLVDRYVAALREAAEYFAARVPGVVVPSDGVLLGLVGGWQEQMLAALEAAGAAALPAVAKSCADLFITVVAGPAAATDLGHA